MKAPRVPEKAEQAHIVQLLRSVGGRAYVLGTTRRRGDYHGTMQTEGVPDVIGFVPRRGGAVPDWVKSIPTQWVHVYIECKARGGRLRPEQKIFRELCQASGVEHVVGGLDDVIAWLAACGVVKRDQFQNHRQPKEARS